ncbi:MAG: hypothetical protein KA436_02450 [Oligoflexales bacterium]|nr:hypothetical protein [Oligoflexales bacterium]
MQKSRIRPIHLEFLFFLLLFTSQKTFADSVTEVDEAKGKIHVDVGSDSGFTKGAAVCFFDENKAKVGCGKVKAAKPAESLVKVSKKTAPKIKAGFKVALKEGSTPPAGTTSSAPSGFMSIRAFTFLAPLSTSKFNNISYYAPETSAKTVDTLWQASGTTSSIDIGKGFGGEVEFSKFHIAAGLKYGLYQTYSSAGVDPATLTAGKENLLLNTEITSSSLSFYGDYTSILSMMGVSIGAGLDIDMNTVTLTGTQKDSNGAIDDVTAYSLTSSLTVISLRFPVRYTYRFGSAGLFAGLTALLPVSGTASGTPSIDDPNSSLMNGDTGPDVDLTTQLGHGKNSFGLEILIGGSFSF